MPKSDDLSRSAVALDQDSTLISVIEMSQSTWLVAGIVPGLERHPLKKLDPEPEALVRLLGSRRRGAQVERSSDSSLRSRQAETAFG
jgi:transposase